MLGWSLCVCSEFEEKVRVEAEQAAERVVGVALLPERLLSSVSIMYCYVNLPSTECSMIL
jgi:hypothetical protein